jgi:hypothetical protein
MRGRGWCCLGAWSDGVTTGPVVMIYSGDYLLPYEGEGKADGASVSGARGHHDAWW